MYSSSKPFHYILCIYLRLACIVDNSLDTYLVAVCSSLLIRNSSRLYSLHRRFLQFPRSPNSRQSSTYIPPWTERVYLPAHTPYIGYKNTQQRQRSNHCEFHSRVRGMKQFGKPCTIVYQQLQRSQLYSL